MRSLKKTLSLALALALCLGLTVPAFADTNADQAVAQGPGHGFALKVGAAEYVDRAGLRYQFSNPVSSTATEKNYYNDMMDETYDVLYNVFPKGTVLTIKAADGSLPEFADLDNPCKISESYIMQVSSDNEGLYIRASDNASAVGVYEDDTFGHSGTPMKVGDTEVVDADGTIYRLSAPVTGFMSNFELHHVDKYDFYDEDEITMKYKHTYYTVPVGTTLSIWAADGSPVENFDCGGWYGSGIYETNIWQISEDPTWIGAGDSGNNGILLYGVKVEQPADSKPAEPEKPTEPVTPPADTIPASGTALASTQTVTVDGKKVEFQMYALADANGNLTNYIKLRDMAYVLNGTKAQFAVGYDGTISLTTGKAYEVGGTEMTTPYSGDRAYKGGAQTLKVDGKDVIMTAITLTDDNGGGYNYFKLRDLGKALGFNVGYSNENGVFIESDKPYSE